LNASRNIGLVATVSTRWGLVPWHWKKPLKTLKLATFVFVIVCFGLEQFVVIQPIQVNEKLWVIQKVSVVLHS
jgi:hypothetical protein